MTPEVICLLILGATAGLGALREIYRPGLPKVIPGAGEGLICYGPLLRVVGLLQLYFGPLLFTTMVISHAPRADDESRLSVGFTFLCVLLPLFGTWAAWETTRSLVVSRAGLDCRSPWKARRLLTWSSVRKITSDSSFLVIHATDGWKFMVSCEVQGIQEFLSSCGRHLPPTAFQGAYRPLVALKSDLGR